MSDEPNPVRLPPDVRDIAVMRALLSVPPTIHKSVVENLASAGNLYAIREGNRPNLAAESDYLKVLSDFCDRVPESSATIETNRAIRNLSNKTRRELDGARTRARRELGYRRRK